MSKTYTIAKAHAIQSRDFAVGDVVGTGDVDRGEFTPAEGCEAFVALGHVIPRLQDGRIVEAEPETKPADAKSAGKGKAKAKPADAKPADGN